ncbi:MAG: hypothetical protein LBH92_02570 [Bacteroidales bacterium]|jgi:antitoxin component YwqK of YwqJK toxin-antitoxin module|nr:hypothetical protein [Bacteroidales bacterium]
MKKITFLGIILISVLFFASCNSSERNYKEVIIDAYEDGFPRKINYYTQDSILIKTSEFHPNHMLFIEGRFKDQTRDGHWKSWRDNGVMWSEAHYKNGVQHGDYRTYHENGQLYIDGHFKNGKHSGTWNFYDEDGQLLKTVKY